MSQQVISFHYRLTDKNGQELDTSKGGDPMTFLSGSQQIIPGLERELVAMPTGSRKQVTVKAAEAYGEYSADNVMEVPIDQFPSKEVKVGDKFRAGNDHQSTVVTVTKVSDSHVTIDGNHPLAGQDLTFDVELVETRAATEDEIAHGHVHGPGGHHHH
jgi:FKBP-type peptidyl-prolyl cis-trans isomerase SlyD